MLVVRVASRRTFVLGGRRGVRSGGERPACLFADHVGRAPAAEDFMQVTVHLFSFGSHPLAI
jgi:hypothetical protein